MLNLDSITTTLWNVRIEKWNVRFEM